ncbi:MAG TPA: cupin domain-containing protein [Tetragenococcus sp.]|nr:cupin domain-containing protein [Tetragenococcus sp.]
MSNIGEQVKKLRQAKKLTLKEMSQETGLSTGYLSQFERGITTIAVEHLVKISEILGVAVSSFFEKENDKDPFVVRSYEQETFQVFNQNVYKTLSASPEDKKFLPKLVEILPSVTQEEVKVYPHKGEEFVYILSGILTLLIEDKHYLLYPGDSAHFQSTIAHNWANHTQNMVRFIVVHEPSDYEDESNMYPN